VLNAVWSAKVRIFAWRLATDALATQENRRRRALGRTATCQVCGMEDETGHHAVTRYTKAVALRSEVRKYWNLPPN
jgi:hypothetical protein